MASGAINHNGSIVQQSSQNALIYIQAFYIIVVQLRRDAANESPLNDDPP